MRKWIVRVMIVIMVLVAVAGTVVAATQKSDTPEDSLTSTVIGEV